MANLLVNYHMRVKNLLFILPVPWEYTNISYQESKSNIFSPS